jgi:(E)-4-hydroxy-3-methylbut-2-enyl-diphosphate synthase
MVEAYRLLIENMFVELGHCYPLHLGVTEAGDGEDGRIKSAIGIGTLLEDGIGDTIRVSLTEDPEFEIPVCKDIVKRYTNIKSTLLPAIEKSSLSILSTNTKRDSFEIQNIGGKHVPVVIADFSKKNSISPTDLKAIGYNYDVVTDKWNIGDMAADYIFCAHTKVDFALPGTLRIINYYDTWKIADDKEKCVPIFDEQNYLDDAVIKSESLNFVMLDCYSANYPSFNKNIFFKKIKHDDTAVLCLSSTNKNAMQSIRRMFIELQEHDIKNPVVFICDSNDDTMDESLIHYAIETGALLLDGFGNGICLGYRYDDKSKFPDFKLMNSIAFGILQATRSRISKTEYISCPSCGRTLFDLQETTAKIRAVTNHLKGVKIAIMGCIVNGPGEMADADFGYVGSGTGKITLYRGKEVIKRSVPEAIAVEELINLLKESDVWVEPPLVLV